MIDGKTFRQGLDKFFKSPTCQGARVQIELPNGEMYDITGAKLLENRILGSKESHRLVLTCNCLLYTSPSPRDRQKSRMPSSA